MTKRTRVATTPTAAITITSKAKNDLLHCGNVTVKKPKRVLKKITVSIYIILPKKKDRRTLPPIYKFVKS